jgi:prepilin-type N-terminal cleavage/methylation domain-containing protein
MRKFNVLVLGVRRRLQGEGGFTLIELMAAVGVLLVAAVALAYTATLGFTDIGFARQRQGANQLANQAIEQVSALPFSTLANGLSNTDLANSVLPGPNFDPNIVLNGPCGTPTVYCYNGEQIPRGGNPNVTPLVPHRQTIQLGATTYTVATYVTYYNNITTANTFRVTAQVSWANPIRKGVNSKVITQTIKYSASGCLSGLTHPFSAPCQPFFFGNSTRSVGHIDVTGSIDGINLDPAGGSLLLPSQSSNAQIEQISAVQGISKMSGASLTLTGQPAVVTGAEKFTSGADNDPAQPGQDYNSLLANGAGGPQSASGNGNTLTLTPSAGDTGSTTSTTDASPPSKSCPIVGSETDLQACGSSKAQQAQTSSMTLSLNDFGANLGTTSMASLTGAPSAGSSFVNRDLQNNADGLIHSDASRTMGTLTLGGLPSRMNAAAIPPAWQGYLVQITGFTDSVSSETGTNTSGPAANVTGTINYWTGSGYSTYALVPGPSVQIPVFTLLINDTVSGKPVQVKIQGGTDANGQGLDCNSWVLGCPTTGGTSTAQVIHSCSPTPCPNTRDSATAQSASPLVATLHYTITVNGNVVANFAIHVDLGTLLVQNTYQVAPSAT